MNTIFIDPPMSDEVRRSHLFKGQLFVFSPKPSSLALCEFADELIRKAFGSLSPERAQYSLPVEEYAGILEKLKPMFINHSKSKKYIQDIVKELGCDPAKAYFDVPRMRTSTSDGYLTTGIAYAWHPHRDTWYSAPQCQINWWIPIYGIDSNHGVAFHPRYWTDPIPNDSRKYNYYQWNKEFRPNASKHLKEDPRPLPRPTEPVELNFQIRPVCPVGGIIMFAGAQLHSSVPNTSGKTRFSIDFRTVHYDDLVSRSGAPNIDSECTGTSLRDFLSADDLSPVADDIVALYSDGTETMGNLVYQPVETNTTPK